MGKDLPALAKAEWALMEALWTRGRATAGAIQADLQPTRNWAYSTVKTILDRLVEKGYVKSRRVGNVYEYTPKFRRGAIVAQTLEELTDRVLSGSVTPLFQHLVERRGLTTDEVRELRKMLDEYDDTHPPKETGKTA